MKLRPPLIGIGVLASGSLGQVYDQTGVEPQPDHYLARRATDDAILDLVAEQVTDLSAGVDLLTDQPVEGELTLEPYGVAIIQQSG